MGFEIAIAGALKLLDVVDAFVKGGFTFDAAFSKVSNFIKGKAAAGATEISDVDLDELFDDTDAKVVRAAAIYEKTLADPNTPKR